MPPNLAFANVQLRDGKFYGNGIYDNLEFVLTFERWKSDILPSMIKQAWYVVHVSGNTSISLMPKHYYEQNHKYAIERSSPVISEIQLIKPKHEFIPAY